MDGRWVRGFVRVMIPVCGEPPSPPPGRSGVPGGPARKPLHVPLVADVAKAATLEPAKTSPMLSERRSYGLRDCTEHCRKS
jgi:hypothetical protein